MPLVVELQAACHAVALKAPPPEVGTKPGAPLQVPVQVPLSWPHCPFAWHTADRVPVNPPPQAAALHVWPCTVWLHAAAQAVALKGAPLVIQPAAAEGMGVVLQAAVALSGAGALQLP